MSIFQIEDRGDFFFHVLDEVVNAVFVELANRLNIAVLYGNLQREDQRAVKEWKYSVLTPIHNGKQSTEARPTSQTLLMSMNILDTLVYRNRRGLLMSTD